MQKIIIVLFITICLAGCSASKYHVNSNTDKKNIDLVNFDLSEVKKNNLTSFSFFIQKAEVEIVNQGEKQKFIASLKYRNPDSFLISLRSTTGIEAARIFLSKDTVLINDRINKTFYFGSYEETRKKYGFSWKLLPLLFGDVIANTKSESSLYYCEKGISTIETFIDEFKISYIIDCKRMKSISVSVTRDIDTKPVYIQYEDYNNLANVIFTKKASIADLNNFDIINIKFSKLEIPWEGTIKFVTGNNYEQKEIK